jgi:hypothetical protein
MTCAVCVDVRLTATACPIENEHEQKENEHDEGKNNNKRLEQFFQDVSLI